MTGPKLDLPLDDRLRPIERFRGLPPRRRCRRAPRSARSGQNSISTGDLEVLATGSSETTQVCVTEARERARKTRRPCPRGEKRPAKLSRSRATSSSRAAMAALSAWPTSIERSSPSLRSSTRTILVSGGGSDLLARPVRFSAACPSRLRNLWKVEHARLQGRQAAAARAASHSPLDRMRELCC